MSENTYQFKGTPGPWKPLHLSGLGQHWYSVTDDNGEETQDIYWVIGLHEKAPDFSRRHEEKLANIHLVAAAPDLLEACIEMANACNRYNLTEVVPEYEKMVLAVKKAFNR